MWALGIAFWMLAGAAIALACIAVRGWRLWRRGGTDFAGWLDRECEAEFGGEWRRCTVVAVSHKGAVAVREDGEPARWIPKGSVPERVRWVW